MTVKIEESATATTFRFQHANAQVRELELVPGKPIREGEVQLGQGGPLVHGITLSVRPARSS